MHQPSRTQQGLKKRTLYVNDIGWYIKESKIFSKVDLKNGYWQAQLDDESSILTTFQVNEHRYRWTGLPFWLKTSSEIFQRKINENLQMLRKRYKENGIRLNKEKLETNKEHIVFMGHCITKVGLKID